MRCAAVLGMFLVAACSAKVPDVDPTAFACEDDAPLADGSAPCPDSHWCSEQSCTERFGCFIEGGSKPGCDPNNRCADPTNLDECRRCDLSFNNFVAAVSCGPGLHTATSTRPADLDTCACPDGTSCVAFSAGGSSSDAYPLYVLPPGVAVPTGKIGFTTDIPDRRMCTRACSSELDCPAAHTCRAAAVVTQDLLVNSISSRSTIGVCWPEFLVSTSTITPIEQPNADACLEHADCPSNFPDEPCRFRTLIVPDHPRVPAGSAWGTRYALVSRCLSDPAGSLKTKGLGCTEDAECKSGLCGAGQCSEPCNPQNADVCPFNVACRDTPVTRVLPGLGIAVEERAQICAPD